MGPLVDLVREGDHDAKRHEEAVGEVPVMVGFFGLEESVERQAGKRDERDEAVVAVRLDEVVTRYGEGIDVVLSKRADERLGEQGGVRVNAQRMCDGNRTLPKIGISTEPQESAAQWTRPDIKSANRIPKTVISKVITYIMRNRRTTHFRKPVSQGYTTDESYCTVETPGLR